MSTKQSNAMMNDQMQQALESAMVKTMERVEGEVDSELHRLENLDDDELTRLREKRLLQMKRDAEQRAAWRRNGHGSVHHVTEKDFFTHAKSAPRMVAIFYRKGTSRYADDLLAHVERVAQRHVETLFITLDAEKSPFLCTRLNIRVLPSLVMTKGGEIEKMLVGLDALCGASGKFTTTKIERKLFELEMLTDTNIADDS